jgi:thiol:disulfide interchange protein DsbD
MMSERIRGRLPILGFLLLALLSIRAIAAPEEAIDPGEIPDHVDVPVQAILSHEALRPGDSAKLAVIYRIPPQSHIQVNDFFTVEVRGGLAASLGAPTLPTPGTFFDEPIYQGNLTAIYPVQIPKDAPIGASTIEIAAGYQACLEEPVFVCFAPEERTLSVPVEIVSGDARPNPAAESVFAQSGAAEEPGSSEAWLETAEMPATTLEGKLEQALKRGSFLAYLFVFLGGVATSFTPCVYPMIPITISYIGGSSRGRIGGFFLSCFFVLGIAITYSILGMVAARTGALFGNAMQSTGVLVAVALVFLAMGASMLGAFDLALPSSLQSKLSGGPRTGVVGAILMGAVTGIVASPCVGPVLVVLLTWVAQIGSLVKGFTLLFTFACGLGLLFLVIGTFAGALNALPSAGQWMDTVKHVFGVILIAMAIYYVRSIIGPSLTWMAAGLLALLTGTFVGAFRHVPEDPENGLLLRKGFGIAMALCGGFALLAGLAGVAGISVGAAPSGSMAASDAVAAEHPGLDWVMDDVEGRSLASTQSRPVVIDFYADWCTACKELDHKTWVDERVRAESERFVAVKLDFTKESPETKQKMESYEIKGLPTVIFLDSTGKEVQRFFGFRDADAVLALMQSVR